MPDSIRISIYYSAALGLLAVASILIFGRSVIRAPVYSLPDGLVVYSDDTRIHAGDRLVTPGCHPAPPPGPEKDFLCSIIHQDLQIDVVMSPIAFQIGDLLRIFHAPLILAFFMLLSAVWFIENGKDFIIASFFASFSFFILLSIYVLVYEQGALLWTAAGYFVALNFLNLNLRTSGFVMSTRILLAEGIFLIFLVLLLLAATDSLDFRIRSIQFGWSLFWLVLSLSIIFQLLGILDPSNDRIDRIKRIVSFLGLLAGIGLPIILLFQLDRSVPPLVYLALILLFPLSLFYGTYRMYLVPFQFFVTRGIAAVLLTISFLFVYMAVLYVYSELIPGGEFRWIASIVFLALLVFFLDPFRARMTAIVERQFLIPRGEHSESLKRLASLVSRSSRPRVFVQAMLEEINTTLGLQRSFLLTSPDFFFYLDLREQNVLRLPATSPLWKTMRPGRMVFSPYLNIATGRRREIFEFFFHRKLMMGIGLGESRGAIKLLKDNTSDFLGLMRAILKGQPIPKPAVNAQPYCALLLGYPPGRTKLYLHEIRYLQEASRLMGMTLFNVHALFREVDKRKRVREFHLSGQYQKLTMLRPDEPPETVDYRFFNRPVLSVTGDYIDFIQLDPNHVAVFLGDVSGHGLGTGFLVSAVRSIVRTGMAGGRNLGEVLGYLNEFLSDRYSGYEFLTLFAMILHLPDGQMEYVNAAHPGAFLKLPGGGIEKLENTQRLLGILPGPYVVHSHHMRPGERIFLFSDGVLETTNPREEFFGEQRLAAFIAERGDDPLDEIVNDLRNGLSEFRGAQAQMDDTSFLVVEYLPARSLLDFVLKGLGLRR